MASPHRPERKTTKVPKWFAAIAPAGLVLCCWLSACDDPSDPDGIDVEFDASVSLSELIPTVATLSFEADLAEVEEAYVEFGLPGEEPVRVPAHDDGEGGYTALVLGMKAGQEYRVRPVVEADGDVFTGPEETLVTGAPPTDLPELSVTVWDEERAIGGYFVMPLLSNPSAAVIVDADGDYVWWHQEFTEDFPVPRAIVSHDFQQMLYLGRQSLDGAEFQPHIYRVALDGSSVDTMYVENAHHDFTELPDGTLALITHDTREIDGQAAIGDKVVEVSPDGDVVDVWSVWDHLEFDPDAPVDAGTNWSHSNALDYSVEDDSNLISVRNFDTLFGFERATGETFLRVGGAGSDHELDEEGEWFNRQHQFALSGTELMVFSNGVDVQNGSQILGYQLEDDVAVNHWDYQPEFPLYCYTFGDVNLLDNGNLLVTWSTAGQMEEITPDGEIVWQLKAALGGGFGYTTQMASLYPAD